MMRSFTIIFLFLFIGEGCVDRIIIDTGEFANEVLVVDGGITDQLGPYTVNLRRASKIDGILNLGAPYLAKTVIILDDHGNTEILTSPGGGTYNTSTKGIRGTIGRKYRVQIELQNGAIFESIPEELKPVGKIDSLYYEFETLSPQDGSPTYGFRVFMNSSRSTPDDEFIRWRFTGVYRFLTYPELRRLTICKGPREPDPCSGFIANGELLQYVKDCSCCLCWVNDYENKPNLSDVAINRSNSFKKIEVGFVPFNAVTFSQNKYMVRVEQMSLTKEAYEYWNIIKDQKEGASSLFQPSFGSISTNFESNNSAINVIGFFYASAIDSRTLFITGADAPIPVPQPSVPPEAACGLWRACNEVFISASRIPPQDWE